MSFKELIPTSNFKIIWLKSGWGSYQIDFRDYVFSSGIILFIEPGQYFKILNGEIEVETISIEKEHIANNNRFRYLFKHLVAAGHISVDPLNSLYLETFFKYKHIQEDIQEFLEDMVVRWLSQNPFGSSEDRLNILFDTKDIIDDKFRLHTAISEMTGYLDMDPRKLNRVLKKTLNYTLSHWVKKRVFLESQRELIFSSKSIKEIGYDLGFNDPSHFNHFFRKHTTVSPNNFRESYDYRKEDIVLKDFLELLEVHYRQEHSVHFYADKLNISEKTLSRKLQKEYKKTPKKIIVDKLVLEAQYLLKETVGIKDAAFELGFEEAHHFSAFLKKHTGKVPSAFSL
ncbi:helix-turn-helix domain-containing protein [Leptobacterium flavescens]|uniref:Helix-turn-helix domain-containing protein n=1 Tax=Leptobacterium flavescens TaxID=472055 RepID=A0A6P0UPC9_9FLAO|nr:helix-turn-helix domain-containing protein [Leptobacterium flavescens]NER15194.1 helix-turn-helix domain-containing protein [Leptobacterium flavescens]